MPPSKEKSHKRKPEAEIKSKNKVDSVTERKLSHKWEKNPDDFLKNVINEEADSTDSEGEIDESDGEIQKPIFESGDEEDEVDEDSSSPGEDSEEDDDEESGDEEEENEDENGNDSESGAEQTASDNESDTEIIKAKNTKQASDKKQKVSKTVTKQISELNVSESRKVNGNNFNSKNQKGPAEQKKSVESSSKQTNIKSDKGKVNKKDKTNDNKKSIISVSKKETHSKTKGGEKQKHSAATRGNSKQEERHKDDVEDADQKKDEYVSGDSSDEEDLRNTVGDIPMKWYEEYPHIGYDWDGKPILKPPQRDQIEDFLKRCEDPDFWRTVKDPMTGQDVVLSKADLEILARLKQGKTPDPSFDDYPEWVEWFSSEVLQTPVRAFPEHKRSFLPSQLEQRQVNRLVRALKAGWIKTRAQDRIDREKKKEKKFYMLWSSDDRADEMRRIRNHIPAPKRALPGHAESYNPPPEYLLDEREMKQWKRMENIPWKRKYTFLPQKFNSLREVPAYQRYIRERFLRCLDLYLAPRAIKMRLTIDPEQLVPKLPSPQDLQPFPTIESMVFRGHTDMVRCIDVDPTGQYLYSGSEDGTVKIWEVSTGRCLKTLKLEDGAVKSVQCIPVSSLSLLAVACGHRMLLLSPGAGVGDHKVAETTDELLAEAPDNSDFIPEERIKTAVQWETVTPEQWKLGIRISVKHFKEVKQVAWHGRGDYACVVLPEGANRSVVVHQISRRRSQLPFSKAKGLIQCALFHPIRPFLFVATQRVVRIYDLVKQELVKKLLTSAQWISNMAIHPGGDNLIVATYDKKMMWFDLDLSSKPYQTLRLHNAAVRGVAFHKRYPLFASGSDDRKIIISHGMVYSDLLQNPLIVPLKQLQTHEPHEDFGVLAVHFHPLQPWLFSAGGDCTIRLYT